MVHGVTKEGLGLKLRGFVAPHRPRLLCAMPFTSCLLLGSPGGTLAMLRACWWCWVAQSHCSTTTVVPAETAGRIAAAPDAEQIISGHQDASKSGSLEAVTDASHLLHCLQPGTLKSEKE